MGGGGGGGGGGSRSRTACFLLPREYSAQSFISGVQKDRGYNSLAFMHWKDGQEIMYVQQV